MPAHQTRGRSEKGTAETPSCTEWQLSDQEPQNAGGSQIDRDQAIRTRAYSLYEARGCADGFDVDDWLQAEAELCGPVPEPAPQAGI